MSVPRETVKNIFEALSAEFPKELERTFQGRGGRSFTYIEPRDVMDRLDSVLTPMGWKFECNPVNDHVAHGSLSIKLDDEWVTREDFGYANNSADDAEHLKEATSDALRRCAMGFGVARYLYRRDTVPTSHGNAPKPQPKPELRSVPQDEEPPFPMAVVADATFAAAEKIFGDMLPDESKCPDHGYDWKTNSRGYFCSGKTNGKWCERKPSKAWAAAQELVPAS